MSFSANYNKLNEKLNSISNKVNQINGFLYHKRKETKDDYTLEKRTYNWKNNLKNFKYRSIAILGLKENHFSGRSGYKSLSKEERKQIAIINNYSHLIDVDIKKCNVTTSVYYLNAIGENDLAEKIDRLSDYLRANCPHGKSICNISLQPICNNGNPSGYMSVVRALSNKTKKNRKQLFIELRSYENEIKEFMELCLQFFDFATSNLRNLDIRKCFIDLGISCSNQWAFIRNDVKSARITSMFVNHYIYLPFEAKRREEIYNLAINSNLYVISNNHDGWTFATNNNIPDLTSNLDYITQSQFPINLNIVTKTSTLENDDGITTNKNKSWANNLKQKLSRVVNSLTI